MSRWYYDDEEFYERRQAAIDEYNRDRYEEKREAQLVAEHEDGEHDHAKVRDCPSCEVQVDDAEEGDSK